MKLYGAAQSGGSLTAVSPGERISLFDGAEAPAAGVTSLAFCRAPGPMQIPAPIVFSTFFAAGAPDATVLIQGSNVDAEAQYQTLFTSTAKAADFYEDAGNFAFYRAKLSAYNAGGMPVVNAQR